MSCCEIIGICIGGALFCVGATVYYTCKFTGYLIFYTCKYTYLGTSWCIRKVYNYYATDDSNVIVQQPSYTGYSTRQNENDYTSYRVVSNHASAVNNNVTISRNTETVYATATTRNYLRDNAIDTNNRAVSDHASTSNNNVTISRNTSATVYATATKTNNLRDNAIRDTNNRVASDHATNYYGSVYVPVYRNPDSNQTNNNENKRNDRRVTRNIGDAANVPVHERQYRARKNVKFGVVDETQGRHDPSSSNWRSGGRANSCDRNKVQQEFRIPTSDVLMPTGDTFAVTIPVHKVKNCCLWTKFQNRQKDIGKETNSVVNQRMLFHGSAAVDDIVRVGFDERHSNQNGLFGAGVYFAQHSSKSNQYAFGLGMRVCPSHSFANCTLCERKMLLCRVTMGTIYYPRHGVKLAHSPPGHHSVAGLPHTSGLQYPEYIIYRGEQAYPEYLITYKIKL